MHTCFNPIYSGFFHWKCWEFCLSCTGRLRSHHLSLWVFRRLNSSNKFAKKVWETFFSCVLTKYCTSKTLAATRWSSSDWCKAAQSCNHMINMNEQWTHQWCQLLYQNISLVICHTLYSKIEEMMKYLNIVLHPSFCFTIYNFKLVCFTYH